jgi:hypothetical protein
LKKRHRCEECIQQQAKQLHTQHIEQQHHEQQEQMADA